MKSSLLFIALVFAGCSSDEIEKEELNLSERSYDLRKDETTWDMEMLEEDIGLSLFIKDSGLEFGPMPLSAFPTPNYDSIGVNSFIGSGFDSYEQNMNENLIRSAVFHYGKEASDSSNTVFFQIIVSNTLPDSVENVSQKVVVSRNHPNYLGQGCILTTTEKIEYLAFTTHDNQSFAVVNCRLFDLSYGKTILISPNKKGFLKSKQVEIDGLNPENFKEKTEAELAKSDIAHFLNG